MSLPPLMMLAPAHRIMRRALLVAPLLLGAAACVPWRLRAVESALVDRVRDAATAEAVATLESGKARTLKYNGFKLPLMENLVRRAVRGDA